MARLYLLVTEFAGQINSARHDSNPVKKEVFDTKNSNDISLTQNQALSFLFKQTHSGCAGHI